MSDVSQGPGWWLGIRWEVVPPRSAPRWRCPASSIAGVRASRLRHLWAAPGGGPSSRPADGRGALRVHDRSGGQPGPPVG